MMLISNSIWCRHCRAYIDRWNDFCARDLRLETGVSDKLTSKPFTSKSRYVRDAVMIVIIIIIYWFCWKDISFCIIEKIINEHYVAKLVKGKAFQRRRKKNKIFVFFLLKKTTNKWSNKHYYQASHWNEKQQILFSFAHSNSTNWNKTNSKRVLHFPVDWLLREGIIIIMNSLQMENESCIKCFSGINLFDELHELLNFIFY